MKVLDYDGTDHLVDKIYDLVNSGGSADYIVEEGTSGIWYYRKWASGLYEAWGQSADSMAMTTLLSTSQYWANKTFYISNLGFTAITNIQTSGQGSGGYSGTKVESFNTSQIIISDRSGSSYTTTIRHFIVIRGLWKEFTPSTSRLNPLTEVLYTGAWTATRTKANGVQLAQTLTVPNGYYIIIIKAPSMSVDAYSLKATINGVEANNSITRVINHGVAVFTAKLTNTSNTIVAISAQSAQADFSYLERGGIFAMRVANA